MGDMQYDVVVIGGGPAGLAAAMFAARRGLRTQVVSKDVGGQLSLTAWIENYPGIDGIGGRALVDCMLAQAKRDGADWWMGEATSIVRNEGGGFTVSLRQGTPFVTKTIILAFGLTPNDLGATGEHALAGKGVYYSAVDDAPQQEGKTIAVVGGGNSAVTAALALAPRAAKVHLIHRRAKLNAEKPLLKALATHRNIETHLAQQVVELRGTEHVSAMVLAPTDPETGVVLSDPSDLATLLIDSVFVQIGFRANTQWLADVVALNAKREVITSKDCETSTPGIFAAGDLCDIAYKQAAVSVGEGVKAALQAFKYLQEHAGKPAVMFDWDVREERGAAAQEAASP
ncbi:MAG: FAD-dependent oxidoreductase [bacterium]|nr:FAD-dependent oxidoreductase [bacterium]